MVPSPQTRDAGVRRVSRLTRWALAGAVGLSTAVSFVVAKVQTGNAAGGGSSGSSSATATVSPAPVIIEPGTGEGLQPALSPPVRQIGGGGGGGVTTSGGS